MVGPDHCPLGPLGIVGSLITTVIDAVTTDNSIEEGEKAQQLPDKAIKQVKKQVNELCEQQKFDDAIALIKQQKDKIPNVNCFFLLGQVLVRKAAFVTDQTDGDDIPEEAISCYKEAISYHTKALALCKPNSVISIYNRFSRAKAEYYVGYDLADMAYVTKSREDMFGVIYYGKESDNADVRELVELAKDKFPGVDNKFADCFHDIDYANRKALMVVDEYTELGQKQIQVLSKEMANKYLKFPIGHPHSNQLYIAHPLINDYYLPFEDYQLQFVEDQVREYCELAQALGATEIIIECLNDNQSDSQENTKIDIDGSAGGKRTKVEGKYHSNRSHHLIDAIRQSIEMHQTYNPTQQPRVPDDLVWYKQMPSWQHLVRQRMNGGLNSHDEKLQTQKSQVVDGNELKQIKGEVQPLIGNVGMSFDKEEESKLQLQENATLSIKIKFAPIEQLQGQATQDLGQHEALTSQEQSFLEEVKFCLEEDNTLSDTDKKYLDRKRAKLGLSPERAEDIIQMCAPTLSAEEQEYIDTFHELVSTAEDISPKIRRMLDREAESLGISEERKAELEKMSLGHH